MKDFTEVAVRVPDLEGISETALFVKDLSRARVFYEEVMGLAAFSRSEHGCGFLVSHEQRLLLMTWEPGGRSIDFRDPDGHLLELATFAVWESGDLAEGCDAAVGPGRARVGP